MILTDHALVMPDKVLKRLDLHFGTRLKWEPIPTTGTRHNLFSAKYQGMRFVTRVEPDSVIPPGVDNLREAQILRKLAEIGGVFDAQLIDPENGLLLMPDLGEVRAVDRLTAQDVEEIILCINRLHRIDNVPSINYSGMFSDYRRYFSHLAPGLLQLVNETEAALLALPDIGSSLVHHDLHSGNLLWNPRLHLIDWEYAGLGNPWLDYATLTRDLGLNQKQIKRFERLSNLDDSDLQAGLALATQVVDQLETIWQRFIALAQPDEQRTTLNRGEIAMSKTHELLAQLKSAPESVEFEQVMAVIAAEYEHLPSAFTNGDQVNTAEQNQGSCKILGFARLNSLSEEATLHCFGKYYREDVLQHPDGKDHGNIRAFMRTGWSAVDLPSEAVTRKN